MVRICVAVVLALTSFCSYATAAGPCTQAFADQVHNTSGPGGKSLDQWEIDSTAQYNTAWSVYNSASTGFKNNYANFKHLITVHPPLSATDPNWGADYNAITAKLRDAQINIYSMGYCMANFTDGYFQNNGCTTRDCAELCIRDSYDAGGLATTRHRDGHNNYSIGVSLQNGGRTADAMTMFGNAVWCWKDQMNNNTVYYLTEADSLSGAAALYSNAGIMINRDAATLLVRLKGNKGCTCAAWK